jgi:cAMP-binding proteins - catabolite gene activator and regulatory subunit of cAMP-dependent protein kinases
MEFFANLPILKGLSRRNLSTLLYHFEHHKKQKGDVLYREGDEADGVYVVKKGEVKLSKEIVAPELANLDITINLLRQRPIKKNIDVRTLE